MTTAPELVLPTVEERALVGTMVSRYRRRDAVERLALYRRHLQVTVTAATPLLGLMAADGLVGVRAAMQRLRPPHGWPEVPRLRSWASVVASLRHGMRAREGYGTFDPSRTVVVRDASHPSGPLALSVVEGVVEVTTCIGEAKVRTGGGLLHLVLGFALPDTIEVALVGRPAGVLVGHPWFADGRWIIQDVRRVEKAKRVRTTVTIATGLDPFAMPWRRLIDGTVDARRRG